MEYTSEAGLSQIELERALKEFLIKESAEKPLCRVLILPPDYTRMYSGAGRLTAIFCRLLRSGDYSGGEQPRIDIMPALGTHVPMSKAECDSFFEGEVDHADLIVHNWRQDVVKIGEVPGEFVSEVSDGLVTNSIDVEVNRRIVSGDYDLIISVGQVVPHEVVGMANYSKNIFVGCGGSSMINSSHMLGAFYGMERIMGRDFSPVRKVFDYAEENFLASVPLRYVLTVTTNSGDDVFIRGLYIGRKRELFEHAVGRSQQLNFIKLDRRPSLTVVYLDPREFKSTWLGNKSIYRTRLAIDDGGELLVLAPGVERFGEDDENDRLIRKYGYVGRENILELVKEHDDLKANLSVAAHLIHGSSDGRFGITYATALLSGEEVESVGFKYRPYDEAAAEFDPAALTDGWHTASDGREFYYISNPALGLWDAEK